MRICFVGDSFVNGTGDPDYLGWTGRVCAAMGQRGYNITHYNLGIRGQTSAEIADRWWKEVSCRLPQSYDGRLVFSFGTNDTTLEAGQPRVAPADSLQYLQQILTQASAHFPVLMVGPPPIEDQAQNDRTADLSRQYQSLCTRLRIPYLDMFTPLSQSPIWMQEVAAFDGAHPGAAGYAEFAHQVLQWSAWQGWFSTRLG